MIFFDL